MVTRNGCTLETDVTWLPCIYPRGHDGHHVCLTPDGARYAFESAWPWP
jgi:hypothetical protein